MRVIIDLFVVLTLLTYSHEEIEALETENVIGVKFCTAHSNAEADITEGLYSKNFNSEYKIMDKITYLNT